MSRASAFPTDVYYDEKRIGQWEGMTLRDYFAAAAVTGFVAGRGENERVFPKEAASRAYAIADAMMDARKKGVS